MLAFLRSLFQRFWKAPAIVGASSEVASSDLAQESAPAAVLVSYDENLLERARTQWQFGDWESLAKLDRETIQHHPDRAKLALLAAAGRLQTDKFDEAKQYLRLSQDWGVNKKLFTRILVAGVHNSLGCAAAIAGEQQRALQHFYSSIAAGTPGSEVRLLAQARTSMQYQLLNLSSGPIGSLPNAVSSVSACEIQQKD
jgi:hypothetical protein